MQASHHHHDEIEPCLICLESVGARAASFQCEYCFTLMHLACVRGASLCVSLSFSLLFPRLTRALEQPGSSRKTCPPSLRPRSFPSCALPGRVPSAGGPTRGCRKNISAFAAKPIWAASSNWMPFARRIRAARRAAKSWDAVAATNARCSATAARARRVRAPSA